MTEADYNFIRICKDIITNGTTDEGLSVRPKWADGTPAHTKHIVHSCTTYNLDNSSIPVLTIRKAAFKNCIDEILWIYQKHSNNVNDLNSHIWDSWADETGSIGKAYGYQMAQVHHYPEGDFTQIDKVIYDLKHNPASRSIILNMYNHADLTEMHLRPCAYSMTFNVTSGHPDHPGRMVLNGLLNQRSQDMLTANNWNVLQYSVLLHMIAQCCDMIPGQLTHMIADAHIYDRHIPIVQEILDKYDPWNRMDQYAEGNTSHLTHKNPVFNMDKNIKDFYEFTTDSFELKEYTYEPFNHKIEVAV